MRALRKLFEIFSRILSYLVPVNPNILVFGSGDKNEYSNSFFLYKYICINRSYKCFWLSQNIDSHVEGGILLKKGSIKSYWVCMRASFMFVTHSRYDVSYISNRKTKIINLWHGSPIKKIGLDSDLFKFEQKGLRRFFKKDYEKWDYFLVASDFWKEIFQKCYNLTEDKIIQSRPPRLASLVMPEDHFAHSGIKRKTRGAKIILYMPTYRQGISASNVYLDILFDKELTHVLEKMNYYLIVKLHPLEKIHKPKTSPRIIFIDDTSVADLYLISDALITDYSSTIFDYTNLRKPVILYLPDEQLFQEKIGGFYVDFETDKDFSIFRLARKKEKLYSILEAGIGNVDLQQYEYFNKKYSGKGDMEKICRLIGI